MALVRDGIIGVDLTRVSAGTTTDGEDAEFRLGACQTGEDGTKYMYVQAAEAISTTTSEPFTLSIDENNQASKITQAAAAAGHCVGVAPQQIIADNSFFWAICQGYNFNMRVSVLAAADVSLWTTTTAGRLDDTSGGSHVRIQNVVLVTAASASTSVSNTIREVLINGPMGRGIPRK
jgi:hypothetical protein